MGKLLTTVCFDQDSLNGRSIAEIVRQGVGFEPEKIRSAELLKNEEVFSKERHLGDLERLGGITSVELETLVGLEGPSFSKSTIGIWNFEALYWKLEDYHQPPQDLLSWILNIRGFNAAYMCDAEDVFWQSVEQIQAYERSGRSHENLQKIPDKTFGGAKIDILKNPGARYLFPGMWLQSAWKMWFGGRAFAYLPRDRLLAFEGAKEVTVLPGGIVFIQLYNDPSEYSKPENRAIQKAFRDWVGIEALASHAQEYGEETSDPALEIEEGVFNHGGVRLITMWFDDQGNPIRRSRAKKRLVKELGPDGDLIWSNEESV